jgi:uncharacterized protein (TIGR00661 family)
MRILYGVVGEGMGHATRSAVVLDHLAASGHEIKVVVSGKAHAFLKERFESRKNVTLEEIHGLTLRYFDNQLQRAQSLFWNLMDAPKLVKQNVKVYRAVAEQSFRPQMVVSDFESFAALYGLRHGIPVVSIDNIQAVNRLKHGKAIRKGFDFELARAAVKVKVPRAYHYLITSFFFPKVRKRYTTLVPPILRKEVLELKRSPGAHVVVYQRAVAEESLLPMLRDLPYQFRVFGASRNEVAGNIHLRTFSGSAFLEDLRTARAVISGGGFSLMSEAVSLRVPMLSVPIGRQFEQELNARYLKELGYGSWTDRLEPRAIVGFLEQTDEFERNLSTYEPRDNRMVLGCLDELIARIAAGKKRPKRLEARALGSYRD